MHNNNWRNTVRSIIKLSTLVVGTVPMSILLRLGGAQAATFIVEDDYVAGIRNLSMFDNQTGVVCCHSRPWNSKVR